MSMRKKDGNRATIYDVAEAAGTSIGTVSKALNGKTDISEDTRQRILSIVEKMGFSANKTASSISRKPIHIAVLSPDTLNDYSIDALLGIAREQEELRDYKISAAFFTAANNSAAFKKGIQKIASRDYQGLIILPPKELKELSDLEGSSITDNLPIITAISDIDSPLRLFCSQCDAEASGRMAAELLGMTVPGAQVAHITGSIAVHYQQRNNMGFESMLGKYGLQTIGVFEHFNEPAKERSLARKLVKNYPNLKGIYISTGVSKDFIHTLKECGADKHIHIIASDAFPETLDFINEGVVTASIFQSPQKQGRMALRYMFEYLTGVITVSDDDPQIYPQPILQSNVEYFRKYSKTPNKSALLKSIQKL